MTPGWLSLFAAGAAGVVVLALWSFETSREDVLLVLALLAPVLSVVLYRRSARASGEALRLALTDGLTGLGNDRNFGERMDSALERAVGLWECVTLCVLDVDDFKRINDRYGHPEGDRVLAEVAACIRADGEGFRLGGDEFALLLVGCDEHEGLAVAERVRERIAAARHSHGEHVTVSAGLATFLRHTVERGELVRLADAALYAAKRDGKNRVRAYRHDLALLPAAHRGVVPLRAPSPLGDLASRVALRMGLSPEHVELVHVAAALNDIGMLALPDELLSKPGPLTDAERRTVERHPEIGHRLLASLGADPLATWVLHHHERWDGAGYPQRLAGERIPLGSRILFVADAYEAMTTDQAWRTRLSPDDALAELERCAGTQFDPRVVEAFVAELRPSHVAA